MNTSKNKLLKWCHLIFMGHHLVSGVTYAFLVDTSKATDERVLMISRYNIFYLTTWNFACQMIFLGMALTLDFSSRKAKFYKNLELIKGYLFHCLVVPGTYMVFTMFWIFFSINREWVYPAVCDEVYPYWLNHASHTNIIAIILVEYAFGQNITPSFKLAFTVLSLVTLLYDAMYLGLYLNTGKWLYSFYYMINWPLKIAFFVAFYLYCVLAVKLNLTFYKYRNKYLKTN